MTEQTPPPYGDSTSDVGAPTSSRTAPPPPPPPVRRFRRSRTDRTLAGVCGGIAESLAMDPVIVRVLMVVLTFFGGAGVIVYGACWLLLPEDEREPSLAERALNKGSRNPWPVLLGIGALALALMISAGWFLAGRGTLLVALVVLGAVLLARRQSDAVGPRLSWTKGATTSPPAWTTPPGPTFSPPPAYPPPPTATFHTDPFRAEPSEPTADDSTTPSASWTPPAPVPTVPGNPRPKPFLGRMTFFAILLALGVLATVDLAGGDVLASAYPAVVVAGAGLGLLIGTRWGRGRWLIPLGVIGALALPPTVFADTYAGDWVDQGRNAVAPANAAGIAPDYSYRGGRIRLDLSRVDFAGADVTTKVRVGAGDVTITVPDTVDVVVDVDLGAGNAEVLGQQHDGFGVALDRTDAGPDGPGGGTLHLRIEQGFGHVEVRRAAA